MSPVASPKQRVLLVNPPSAPGTLANREGAAGMGVVYKSPEAFCYPPHTLAVVASSLREAGYEVAALDGVVEPLQSNLADADAIAVFVSYASLDQDLHFIRNLRQQTAARLIAFGPAMRFVGERVLSSTPVDAVLKGEAEGFCAAALRYLQLPGRPDEPRVLTPQQLESPCCDADGLVHDLETLPFPAWELLPYRQYKLLSVFASRGCPDQCAYCPYAAAQGHRFRPRAVENVLAELVWLSKRFQPGRLVFRDPVFGHDRERVVSICEGILRRRLHLNWECESRPEHFDLELLQLMQRAGCQWIKIGLETTDAPLLQRLRRVSSPNEAAAYLQQTTRVVQTCTKIGLHCRVFVMAGLPGQDQPITQRTSEFVQQLAPTAVNVKALEAYPGIDPAVAIAAAPPEAVEDEVTAQIAILQQARGAPAPRSSPSLLGRGKRWLCGVLTRAAKGG